MNAPECADDRFTKAALSAMDLVSRPIERPRSLLGDGVLTAGGFGILFGQPGRGKSWLALTLARALVRGETWLGLNTPSGGTRVGLMQLELSAHALQCRLRALGFGQDKGDAALSIICRPMLRGTVDLLRHEDAAALRAFVERERLDLLILDALSRCHHADENAASEFGAVLAALDALRHESGTAVIAVHHESKPRDGRDRDDDLAALRGTSRLSSDPTLVVRVLDSRGLGVVRFAKVSEAAKPAPVYYRLSTSGEPEVVRSPECGPDRHRQRVLEAVLAAAQPVSQADLERCTGLGRSAVAAHLKALTDEGYIATMGENPRQKYAAPMPRPSKPSEQHVPDGLISSLSAGLRDSGHKPSESIRRKPSEPSEPSAPTGAADGRTVDGGAPDRGRQDAESFREVAGA